jgi:hypothetical protein
MLLVAGRPLTLARSGRYTPGFIQFPLLFGFSVNIGNQIPFITLLYIYYEWEQGVANEAEDVCQTSFRSADMVRMRFTIVVCKKRGKKMCVCARQKILRELVQ